MQKHRLVVTRVNRQHAWRVLREAGVIFGDRAWEELEGSSIQRR